VQILISTLWLFLQQAQVTYEIMAQQC